MFEEFSEVKLGPVIESHLHLFFPLPFFVPFKLSCSLSFFFLLSLPLSLSLSFFWTLYQTLFTFLASSFIPFSYLITPAFSLYQSHTFSHSFSKSFSLYLSVSLCVCLSLPHKVRPRKTYTHVCFHTLLFLWLSASGPRTSLWFRSLFGIL